MINERNVDKFRVNTKNHVEKKATDTFLSRLEKEFGVGSK